jgi:hypothetical protein
MQATEAQHMTYARPLVAPFLVRGSYETFLGSVVLEEHEGSLAMLLWHSLRCARLWAVAEPEERDRLFLPSAAPEHLSALRAHRMEIEPQLRASLWVLARGAAPCLLRSITRLKAQNPCSRESSGSDACRPGQLSRI